MKVQNVKRLTANNLQAGMSTEFGVLTKVVKRVPFAGQHNVLVETNIMQFDLKPSTIVVIYNAEEC